MKLEQIVKETIAKIVDEKKLTSAEKKKKEDIVMAMKKTFKGSEPVMHAIATDQAKRLAEDGLNEDYEVAMAQDSLDAIIRSAMMLKAQMGDKEINLPAWIQDHITNAESYIYQAAKGYHESDAQMDDNAGSEEMNEEYDFTRSAIESASGDKITGTEEDDEGNTLYIGQDEFDQYFIANGEIKHDNFKKGIKSVTIGMLKHYGDGQNHSANDDMYESQQELDEYVIRRWQHYAGIK
jgi:hypothetical protein